MHKICKIRLQNYKKQIFIYYLNILKTNNKKTLRKKRIVTTENTQLYIPIKRKTHRYMLLRATHEFKYSWEKYNEQIHKLYYEKNIIKSSKNSNLVIKMISQFLYNIKKKKLLSELKKQSKSFYNIPSNIVSNIYINKLHNYTTTKIFDIYITNNVVI
jgi:hypothetical protein